MFCRVVEGGVSKKEAEELHRKEIGGSRCKGKPAIKNPSVGLSIGEILFSTPDDLDGVKDIARNVRIEFFIKLKKTTKWMS